MEDLFGVIVALVFVIGSFIARVMREQQGGQGQGRQPQKPTWPGPVATPPGGYPKPPQPAPPTWSQPPQQEPAAPPTQPPWQEPAAPPTWPQPPWQEPAAAPTWPQPPRQEPAAAPTWPQPPRQEPAAAPPAKPPGEGVRTEGFGTEGLGSEGLGTEGLSGLEGPGARESVSYELDRFRRESAAMEARRLDGFRGDLEVAEEAVVSASEETASLDLDRNRLAEAVVWSEILSKPKALRARR